MAGLRERKKQQTRRHISDVATGLFCQRGFEAVTVAEIAEAADVSVNTVYNYFPTKEGLFFDREDEVVSRLARRVRERAVGESAAEAVLRGIREDILAKEPTAGLTEHYGEFLRVVFNSPTLTAYLMRMQRSMGIALAEVLREEAGAGPGDRIPDLIAGQLVWVQSYVYRIAGEFRGAATLDERVAHMLETLEAAEYLLSDRVLGYARRPPGRAPRPEGPTPP
ncbi:TetR/AcrR family transcriptional regulator [Streptomyces hoynatensis]|uniref:TetR/AcrR family transcriptional regulator n=1 Tax=Streptomyces hoynatensis TaxID=1141874 RepID=A0A3A9YYC6_9ACTN|nr:TetR/AcrR family transcriptional regulator [Streptomyces hoynatensis]RKN40900.1 TetR/AcrR family transcriptional regulator [Streptomyces hoynatensis]